MRACSTTKSLPLASSACLKIPSAHAFSIVLDEPLDWTMFALWLAMLLQARGDDVLRVKGLLDTGADGPLVLHGVQHVIHPPTHLDAWPDDDRASRIVVIARGIGRDELEASLRAFEGAARKSLPERRILA